MGRTMSASLVVKVQVDSITNKVKKAAKAIKFKKGPAGVST